MHFSASERMAKVMMGFLILLYFIFTCGECENQDTNPCTPEKTCVKCIQKDPRCAWCSQEDFTKKKIPRCDFVEDLRERNCSDLVYPESSMKNIVDPEERYARQFCECNDFRCDRADGKICGGPERGECSCGICMCKDGWTGIACDCLESNDACMGPNGEICSGHGDCVCGACQCNEPGYTGKFCHNCPTCPGKCDELKDCVECMSFSDYHEVPPEDCEKCSFLPILVDKLEVDQDQRERLCVFTDYNDCRIAFKYSLDEEDRPIVHVQSKKDCPVQFIPLTRVQP